MGQYFTFLNIDKRQSYCRHGKFGEIFLESSPGNVIQLLAVPGVQAEKEAREDHETMHYSARTLDDEDDEPLSWAGDRIICIGDYVADWPDNILTADDGWSLESPQFLYRHAIEPVQRSYQFRKIVRPLRYSGTGVLRNLTKKLYVRSEGIPTLNTENELVLFEDSPVDSHPGLGHILLCRIGWSADPSAAMAWDQHRGLTQGEWAGDRFDVRSYEDVKEELESGSWVDVTEREAERFASIWKADGV